MPRLIITALGTFQLQNQRGRQHTPDSHHRSTHIFNSMKTNSARVYFLIITVVCMGALAQDQAPKDSSKPAPAPQKSLPSDPEERFKAVFTKATLSGRWARLKDGVLGEERTGDKYAILNVIKRDGDNWTVNAKMKYGEKELIIPVPVRMKFTGDTALLTVDELAIPGGGTYTARLMIFERTYSGTWKDQRGGGMLYGTITNEGE